MERAQGHGLSSAVTQAWLETHAEELRAAAAALLAHADTWRDAEPGRHLERALYQLQRAHDHGDPAHLYRASQALVATLDAHEDTPPASAAEAVAALRRIFAGARRSTVA